MLEVDVGRRLPDRDLLASNLLYNPRYMNKRTMSSPDELYVSKARR
jgi:hypothetical protein